MIKELRPKPKIRKVKKNENWSNCKRYFTRT
jgi:hypothetical protein